MKEPNESHRLDNLARQCGERAWRLAWALTHNRADAEDVAQQAFVVAARKLHAIPEYNPWPWFATVVTFEAKNLRRKRRQNEEYGMAEPIADKNNPLEDAQRAEFARELDRSLARLSQEQRDAITLTQLSGLSYAEAAAALNMPVGTVKSHVARGMEALKAKFGLSDAAMSACLSALPILPPTGGMEHALVSWVASAQATALTSTAAIASGNVIGSTVSGGLIMANKAVIAASLAIGIGVGVAGTQVASAINENGNIPAPIASVEAPEKKQEASDIEAVRNDLANLRIEMNRIQSERDRFQSENDDLRSSLATVSNERDKAARKLSDLQASVATMATTDSSEENASAVAEIERDYTFDQWHATTDFSGIDWKKAASSLLDIEELIRKASTMSESGEDKAVDFSALDSQKLILAAMEFKTLSAKLSSRLPSYVNAKDSENSLSHPYAVVQIVANALDKRGHPLSEQQLSQIEVLGLVYERDWTAIPALHGAAPFKLAFVLDEAKLKKRFYEQAETLFTPEQKSVLDSSDDAPISLADMFGMRSVLGGELLKRIHAATREELASSSLQTAFKTYWGLSADQIQTSSYLVDEWLRNIDSLVGEADSHPTPRTSGGKGLTMGVSIGVHGDKDETDSRLTRLAEEQLRVMRQILNTTAFTPEARQDFLNCEVLFEFTVDPPPKEE